MSGVQHLEIKASEADMRFDRWCRKHFPGLSHIQLQKLLRKGQFRLDGKRVQAGDRVAEGQLVRVPPMPQQPAPGVRPTTGERDARFIRSLVIHEDEHIIAIAKPPGIAVQGGSKTTRHIDGMLDALQGRGEERPKLVHRLDRDTSGVLVLARTTPAARMLMHAFQQHDVEKLYWAIVLGKPDRNEGMIDLKIGKDGPAGRERMHPNAPGARRARTDFRVIARSGRIGAWVGLMPETGRTHQLRAHMAAIGTPILGDTKYRGDKPVPETAPPGLMLHARELDLPHPAGGRLRLKAEPPQGFRDGLAWLGLVPEPIRFTAIADWHEEE